MTWFKREDHKIVNDATKTVRTEGLWTKCGSCGQAIFAELGKAKSYGNSTTQMGKLVPKLRNRASGGCPVLAFGIKKAAYDPTS